MGFAANNVELTCLWPLIWQTSREVWSEQDLFPSIVTTDPPFNPTLSHDMFRMLSALPGGTLVQCEADRDDVVIVSTSDHLFVINKNPLRRRITINRDISTLEKATGEMIGMKHQVVKKIDIQSEGRQLRFFAEPFSLNVIRIK